MLIALCPQCNKEIKVRKDASVGYCMYCGTKLDIPSVIAISGKADKELVQQNISDSMNAGNAGNYEKALMLIDAALLDDETSGIAWHIKAKHLVNLGFTERNELSKKEDADFSRKLASTKNDTASMMDLINSKNDNWKEKSHRAFRTKVKAAAECESKACAIFSEPEQTKYYDEFALHLFNVAVSKPDKITGKQTGDVWHFLNFSRISNTTLLEMFNIISKRIDGGNQPSIFTYALLEIKNNVRGMDISLESKLLQYESQIANFGDFSFLDECDIFDDTSTSIVPTKANNNSKTSANEEIDIQYYKKKLELKEKEIELHRQEILSQARCPKCGSTSLTVDKKGFGFGKAAIGSLLIGPVGLLAGGIGAKKQFCICLNCKNTFDI